MFKSRKKNNEPDPIFEDFCHLHLRFQYGSQNRPLQHDEEVNVIVEIVSHINARTTLYHVIIRRHDDEDNIIAEFDVKKGLITNFLSSNVDGVTFYSVMLNSEMLSKPFKGPSDDWNWKENLGLPDSISQEYFEIKFVAQSTQQQFLSQIRRLQEI